MYLLKDSIIVFLIGLALIFAPAKIKAQFPPRSDQYINNTLVFNPAVAGSDEALSINMIYRNQWVGMDGSPKTLTMAIHSPISSGRIGLGFLLLTDNYGINRNTIISGNYAFRTQLRNGILALGLSVGITIQEVAWNDLIAIETDDDKLTLANSNNVLPNFGTGVYYNSKRLFAGLSLPNLLSYKWDNSNKYTSDNNFSELNYFGFSGYRFYPKDQLEFIPSTLVRYNNTIGINFDLTAQINFQERVGLGLTYRSEGALVGLLRCKLNHQTSVSYSYGFETGKHLSHAGGSHEIMLKYIFNYKVNIESPR